MLEDLRAEHEEHINPQESAAKKLSLSLMQTETPEQVLNIFEREYLRYNREGNHGEDRSDHFHPEELCLVLYFVTKNLS